MKTVREKLARLLMDSPTLAISADYLISNGVTIPVVCEECKYFDPIDENLPYNAGLCSRDNSYCFPLDFCSYGERKEEM